MVKIIQKLSTLRWFQFPCKSFIGTQQKILQESPTIVTAAGQDTSKVATNTKLAICTKSANTEKSLLPKHLKSQKNRNFWEHGNQ